MRQPDVVSTASLSLHEQVRKDLLARIEGGEFKPGDMLPSEDALCEQYGVSRITIRRAVTDLAAQFLVSRRRGVGTIVTRRLPSQRVFRLNGYLGDSTQLNFSTLLETTDVATEEIAKALEIEVGTTVDHLRTVSHREGEPFTLTEAYKVSQAVPDGATSVVTNRLGPRIARAEQELDAVKADALAAEHLSLKVGQPIMRARRVFLNSDDKPVRYTISVYHPDRYRFTVDLRPRIDAARFEPN